MTNLFEQIPSRLEDEEVRTLATGGGVTVECIVSTGQATPSGEWYDQERDEFVVVLEGSAALLFEGEPEPRTMRRGDWVCIPAHVRHRVEWTDAGQPTVWLAVHYPPTDGLSAEAPNA
jgi:cupin 2 domain-containing protein